MFSEGTVTVITATIGHRNLLKCLRSVQEQTYPHVEHFVVVDGPEHEARIRQAVAQVSQRGKPLHALSLPAPTGKEGWNGHRIYAALSFLAGSQFVAYLDDDNWFDADHLDSLVAALRRTASTWAFSLRTLVDENGEILAPDNCESLGNLHHVYNNKNYFLVDTSCYLLPREVAVAFAPVWYRPARSAGGSSPDQLLCQLLLRKYPRVCSNRKHTVNYLVGNRPDSVQADYFLKGNAVMARMYPRGLPWERDPE